MSIHDNISDAKTEAFRYKKRADRLRKKITALQAENKRLREAKKQKCKWVYDDDYDYWDTDCGEAFTILEGTPDENKMRYCPYCGKLIAQALKETQ